MQKPQWTQLLKISSASFRREIAQLFEREVRFHDFQPPHTCVRD